MKRTISWLALAMLSSSVWAQSSAPVASSEAPSNNAVKDPDVQRTSVAAEGANSFTEGQAQERIAKAGFSDISELTKDNDGLWRGMATRGGKKVHVALDYKGNVTSK